MKTVLLLKGIYEDGFKNLSNLILKYSLKAFTWFTVILFILVLYAFMQRLFSGFGFSNI
ncbi:DUF6747 family protein [Maribacter arcticus]|uniref:Uncharacterized protein n=1 Tax=Maribacter arcticus TaxID=561365 RepID=A0A1T5DD03_9FLAO|nr:DUF6747 family protein [Maribacter arcticus]SKB69403.1 hypothetical protein SAMN05660866_02822 [Maribacter arcticus]|tara:strand:- start:86 stop:262 length:177 start_codon:yes stop_codon:yes gene_type:complete